MSVGFDSSSKLWYLVYTKPREERRAETNLIRQGYKVYLPLIRTRKRFKGQLKAIIEPMFPRYLLIQLDQDNDNWAPLRSTIGVSNLVYFGAKPARVPLEVIDILKEHEDENQIFELPEQPYRKGDVVRIMNGPMEGLEGAFISSNSVERAVILLDYIEKKVKIELSIQDIDHIPR